MVKAGGPLKEAIRYVIVRAAVQSCVSAVERLMIPAHLQNAVVTSGRYAAIVESTQNRTGSRPAHGPGCNIASNTSILTKRSSATP
jgi:hypothetical protein